VGCWGRSLLARIRSRPASHLLSPALAALGGFSPLTAAGGPHAALLLLGRASPHTKVPVESSDRGGWRAAASRQTERPVVGCRASVLSVAANGALSAGLATAGLCCLATPQIGSPPSRTTGRAEAAHHGGDPSFSWRACSWYRSSCPNGLGQLKLGVGGSLAALQRWLQPPQSQQARANKLVYLQPGC